MVATIDVWSYVPLAADEEPGFLTYRLAGTVEGRPYCGVVSMEIDGRDGEYESLWGVDLAPDGMWGEEWDAVVTAMSSTPDLAADMADRTEEYYGDPLDG